MTLNKIPLISFFESNYSLKKLNRWNQRLRPYPAIFIMHIEESLFPKDGRNIQKKQLESLANSFGNAHPIFLRPESQGYLEEIVRFRNFIAHGDKLPQKVGRNYTIQDLKIRLTAIDELCTYLIDTYESYIVNHEYLKST